MAEYESLLTTALGYERVLKKEHLALTKLDGRR